MMGKPITMDQLRQDVGNMVEKITKVIAIFRQFQLKMEEYVCLKVIAMVSQDGKKIVQNKKRLSLKYYWSLFLYISFNKSLCLILDLDDPSLSVIHDKYLTCLRTFTKKHFPNQPNRVEELLVRLPEVSSLIWNEYIWFKLALKCFIPKSFEFIIIISQVKKAASLLLESKMFYVPFLLNSSVGWFPTMFVTDPVVDPDLQY